MRQVSFKQIFLITGGLVVSMLFFKSGLGQGSAMLTKKKTDATQHEPAQDKDLLDKFQLILRKMATTAGDYTEGGIININDKAKPTDNMDNVKFLLCKRGDEFYYNLGTTITINEQGVYIYIDDRAKRILISEQKHVTYDDAFKQYGDMAANLKSENYQIKSIESGDNQTISLINEHHITCKQYSVTFNRRSLKISRLFLRLANFNEPSRTDNEKIVDVRITQWDNSATLEKYLTKNKVVRNSNGRWRTVDEYKNYQLVKM